MPTTISLPALASGPMRLTPTDVSQFVRLDQCERFLRSRLAGRTWPASWELAATSIRHSLTSSGEWPTLKAGFSA